MRVVVDASVAAKWYVTEDHSSDVEHLIGDRFKLHAPELLLIEIGNVLWKKCRNGDMDEATALLALDDLRYRRIQYHSDLPLAKPAFIGALETGLTVYDWTYLSLAVSLACKFVTADRKFFVGLRGTRFKGHTTWIGNLDNLI